jgi:hypothetical protein
MGKGIRLGILSVMAMLQEQSTSQSPHRIESSNKTLLRLHRDVVLKVIRGASRAISKWITRLSSRIVLTVQITIDFVAIANFSADSPVLLGFCYADGSAPKCG